MGGALPCELAGWDVDGMYFEILALVWGGYIYKIDTFRGDSEPFVQLPPPREMWLRCDIPEELIVQKLPSRKG